MMFGEFVRRQKRRQKFFKTPSEHRKSGKLHLKQDFLHFIKVFIRCYTLSQQHHHHQLEAFIDLGDILQVKENKSSCKIFSLLPEMTFVEGEFLWKKAFFLFRVVKKLCWNKRIFKFRVLKGLWNCLNLFQSIVFSWKVLQESKSLVLKSTTCRCVVLELVNICPVSTVRRRFWLNRILKYWSKWASWSVRNNSSFFVAVATIFFKAGASFAAA